MSIRRHPNVWYHFFSALNRSNTPTKRTKMMDTHENSRIDVKNYIYMRMRQRMRLGESGARLVTSWIYSLLLTSKSATSSVNSLLSPVNSACSKILIDIFLGNNLPYIFFILYFIFFVVPFVKEMLSDFLFLLHLF